MSAQFPTSPYFTLLETPLGGRSIFATRPIPANTLVHISATPFASVVFREFRKEVCAWCFAYDGWKGLRCKIDDKESGGNFGERFCDETCREMWSQDGMRGGGIRDKVFKAIDAAIRKMKKLKQPSSPPDVVLGTETAWKLAELLPIQSRIHLNEIELAIARLVSSALVSVYLDSTTSLASSVSPENLKFAPSYLSLQQNEFSHILSRPYILATHTQIYQFLRMALIDVPEFASYIGNGSSLVRDVLSRDTGNSFGIWEEVTSGEKEMFGWGIWVDASFFNHNCSPNLLKSRSGRALHFTTTCPIAAGDELCISYLDLNATNNADVKERRDALRDSWFFECLCARCVRESGEMSVMGSC